MLTVLKFTPLDPKNRAFTFLLHPHLKRRNVIDDDLLQLPFVFADEARIQLRGDHPTICSSREILGVYVNHQLLGSTPCILRDGDIVAFPQRRHKLTTAARFLVEMEVLVLSCGVDKELLALQGFAEQLRDEKARKTSRITLEKKRTTSPNTSEKVHKTFSSTSSASSTVSHSIGSGTAAPRIFSYATLVASRVPPTPHLSASPPAASVTPSAVASRSLLGPSSSRALGSTSSDPHPASPPPTSVSASILEAASSHVPPSTSSAAACAPITSSADPSSTSVLTSGLDHSCPVSAATSSSLTSTDAGVAQGTSTRSPTASDSGSASGQVTPTHPSELSSSTERSSSAHHDDGPVRVMLHSAERALHRVGHALLQARLATSGMTTAAVAVERMPHGQWAVGAWGMKNSGQD
ncbi:unnamed protein product [Tilletia controversa]|nr:unnamed protein product [Tilletia controversa]